MKTWDPTPEFTSWNLAAEYLRSRWREYWDAPEIERPLIKARIRKVTAEIVEAYQQRPEYLAFLAEQRRKALRW